MTRPDRAILPGNTDDPMFGDGGEERPNPEWTAGNAIVADLNEPVDEAMTVVTSRFGVVVFVEAFVTSAVEMIGSLIDGLFSRGSPR